MKGIGSDLELGSFEEGGLVNDYILLVGLYIDFKQGRIIDLPLIFC